jgi:hypothetical protein
LASLLPRLLLPFDMMRPHWASGAERGRILTVGVEVPDGQGKRDTYPTQVACRDHSGIGCGPKAAMSRAGRDV